MSTGRIAFIGDINGAPGRMVLEQQLPMLRERFGPLRIVANAENARNGSGLTPDLYETFRRFGIDAMTLGDHVYRDARIVPILEDPSQPISRPANLSVRAQGKRMIRVPATPEFPRDLYIFTLLGRVHMPSLLANDPFACADEMLQSVPERNPVVLVEAHMEATSEKGALARYLDGRVAAVLGTHTHVATADARVLRGGTAFMTDVGMTGPHDSVIGRKPEQVLRHFVSGMHVPFEMGSGGEAIQGAVVEVSLETGLAVSIERIDFPADYSRAPFRTMHSR